MSDRSNIYELLEEAHNIAYPNYSVGEFLKALQYDIGPFEKFPDGELVAKLSGYVKKPFHESRNDRTDL